MCRLVFPGACAGLSRQEGMVCGSRGAVGEREGAVVPLLQATASRYRGTELQPGLLRLTPAPKPPPEKFSSKKKEIYQKTKKLEVDFRYTNLVLASEPSPWYGSRSPLSRGLLSAQGLLLLLGVHSFAGASAGNAPHSVIPRTGGSLVPHHSNLPPQ